MSLSCTRRGTTVSARLSLLPFNLRQVKQLVGVIEQYAFLVVGGDFGVCHQAKHSRWIVSGHGAAKEDSMRANRLNGGGNFGAV